MMENQQSPDLQPTIDELGGKWGPLLSQAFTQIIRLEKQLGIFQMNEAKLLAHIEALTLELAKRPAYPLSSEAAALAADGRAAIQDSGDEEKEKAAPV